MREKGEMKYVCVSQKQGGTRGKEGDQSQTGADAKCAINEGR